MKGFAGAGGTVGLLFQGGRLKFEINTASAEQAGLRLSSQLLKLALRVFGDGER